MLLCWRLSSFSRKKNNSQLFYFFSSSCHNIPPMLKGLDYFGVTCSALSFLSFHKTLSGGGGAGNLCFSLNTCTVFSSDALWKCLTILTLTEGRGGGILTAPPKSGGGSCNEICNWINQTLLQIAKSDLRFADWFSSSHWPHFISVTITLQKLR